MHSTKIAEYKELLEHVPDNWVLGKYVDFPTVIYMEFNSNKVPVLQVLSDVFSNYSLETGEKILDYVFFTHKNFQSLLDENERLEKQVNGLMLRVEQVNAERDKLETLFRTIKDTYLRISGNIFTDWAIGKKLKGLLESIV